jgi:hypothetical protein
MTHMAAGTALQANLGASTGRHISQNQTTLLFCFLTPKHRLTYTGLHDVTSQNNDGQLAACGPNPAGGLIYSGPRQDTGLVRLVKVSISA